ncbi:Cd27 binding protein (Siva) [Popillia japonica]|uniref:Cd27 binding protein (Siva) n=1 Tax=Popillia japonica TaxID=7064 RepID=A0AAW1IBS5_POPJA
MPKRACPFDFNYAPQLKVHVSEKEQTKTMENIWNKTQELLFKAAKKQVNSCDKEEIKCDFCVNVNIDVYECALCNGKFCSTCSMSLYKQNVTESICLSCAD